MCGLFGFSAYGASKDLARLTNELAFESAIRGTDACGIAYRKGKRIHIDRYPKAAYNVHFKHSDDVRVLIGHTRHATQGEAAKVCNDHPFFGRAGITGFALAHNGILTNDRELRKKYALPRTEIETDSYAAVQLLEAETAFGVPAIRRMAEAVRGSFSFSILDDRDRLYLVKGDSPLALLHFPKEQIYVFASTEDILWRALIDTALFTSLKTGAFESIPVADGEILTLLPNGILRRDTFAFTHAVFTPTWWTEGLDPLVPYGDDPVLSEDEDYLAILKDVAVSRGFDQKDVEALLADGFSPEEIEDMIYEPFGWEV